MSIVTMNHALFYLEVNFVERISMILLIISLIANIDLFTRFLFVFATNSIGSSIIV